MWQHGGISASLEMPVIYVAILLVGYFYLLKKERIRLE